MPLPRIARRSARIASLLLAAIVGISTGMAAGAEPAEAGFYDVANDELAGQPGTLIRQERMGGAPQGASAYRVLYRSTGLKGEPIAVSGVVVVPDGPPPAQGRPIVAWAHPTTGIVPHCAPSLAFFVFQQMQGLRDMVARGYIVTATDYPGLGTAGPHPYLVGQSEGRAVLDSVRAARNLAAMSASNRFAVWGHSQGGQAALYAGQLAKDYAPELNLVGVAAAAPATDLGALMRDDLPTPGGKNLLAMTLWSWARVYDAPIDQVVAASALPTVNQLAKVCGESPIDMPARRRASAALQQKFLSVDNLTDREPWKSLLASNTIGTLPSSIPLFLAQGSVDDTVIPSVTRGFMRRQCEAGSSVQMLSMPGVGHGTIAMRSAKTAIAWMANRFAGNDAPSDCSRSS